MRCFVNLLLFYQMQMSCRWFSEIPHLNGTTPLYPLRVGQKVALFVDRWPFFWNYTIAYWNIHKLILLLPNTLSVPALDVVNPAELFWLPSSNFTGHVFWFSAIVSIALPSSDEDEAGKRLWKMLLPLLGYSAKDMWRRKNEECLIGKTGLLFW